MIREIINFTENIIADIPDIMQWKVQLNKGLYVIVEIDKDGKWSNDTLSVDTNCFLVNDNTIDAAIQLKLVQYGQQGLRVGTTMNKVLDKKKQIFSCSPFILSFKKKSLLNEKLEGLGIEKITILLPEYFANAQQTCLNNEERLIQLSKSFQYICPNVLNKINETSIIEHVNGEERQIPILDKIKDEDYINIYLKNATIQEYKDAHYAYLMDKLFNTNYYNVKYLNEIYGFSGFLSGLNSKKPFLEHKTFINNINGRITSKDAKLLADFENLLINKVLPNPLPIIIDKNETNREVIKLFNEETEKSSYSDLIRKLFEKRNIKYLSNYYLINYSKKKNIELNDVDFVTSFRYFINPHISILNILQSGTINDNEFELSPTIELNNIFDFERIVVKSIFNNSLVKIKEDKYSTNYFGDIDPQYVTGGDIMYMLIMKYRKSIYDYIYKSKTNAITNIMFEDMMYQSIYSNIKSDKISRLFSWNNSIKTKLNIWFNLYNTFNNNTENMASKVTELLVKMNNVAKGESHFENPEEFAFGAGQVVSYLIDRSVANNKTYAMLEPYLQKTKSGQLQNAIALSIAVYKHDISTYKGAFQALASDVLTFDDAIDMKPLFKFFLAGCFCDCIIYQKKKNINN